MPRGQAPRRVLARTGLTEAADRRVKTYSGVCGDASTSEPAWSGGHDSCCSTSRPPASTPAAGWRSGTPSANWAPTGTDILLTTQYLDEADRLAASIVIIDEGRVIAEGTPSELKRRAGSDMIELHTRDLPSLTRVAEVLSRPSRGAVTVDEAIRRCFDTGSGRLAPPAGGGARP